MDKASSSLSSSRQEIRDWYDSPQLEDIFAEQEECLPNGPLGFLEPPVVEIEGGLPKEIIEILSNYLSNNRMSTHELGSKMEKFRMDRLTATSPKITT